MNTLNTKTSFFSAFLVGIFLLTGTLTSLVAQTSENEDKDKDGFTVGQGDCNDYQPLVYPGANEIEDGQDNNCDGLIDLVMGDCDDFTDPGEIGGAETICGGQLPKMIQSIAAPTGGTGDMQVMWIYTIDDPAQGYPEWYIVPNAHDLSFQPFAISQTTWFGRCVRRAGCWKFPNESNIIRKEVLSDCPSVDCANFVANVSSTTFPDCDGNLGSATIDLNGGLAPFQYNWSDGMTTQNRVDLNGGNYELTITDANNCTQNLTINIATPDCIVEPDCSAFLASISDLQQPDCDGNLASLIILTANGTAPFTYEWSDGNNEKDRNDLTVGNYDVTINDANGCGTSADVVIIEPVCDLCIDFNAEVGSTTAPDCEGNLGSINLKINGGLAPMTFNWSDGATSQNRIDLAGGFYEVSITDANNCQVILPSIGIPTPTCLPDCSTFSVTINNSTAPDCDDNLGTIDILVNNGALPISYTWSDGATTEDRSGLSGGNYQVTATDANGCSGTAEVNIPTPTCLPDCSTFSVTINNSTAPDCDDNLGTIDILVNNGALPISYTWSDGATTEDRSGLSGGNYQVTATDANGCSGTAEVNIPTPTCLPDCSTFSLTINNSTAPDCDDNLGTIDILVNNGVLPISYTWSDGATTEDRSGLSGGNYQVTATDANGCSGMAEVNIPTPNCNPACNNFSAEVESTIFPDCDGNFGAITLVINNAVEPVIYEWSDGVTTKNRIGLIGGFYQITITDANSCTAMLQVGIATPSCGSGVLDCNAFTAQLINSSRPDCDDNLGTIDVSFINGTAPITYAWADGATTANRTGLAGGKYQVTLTDANGCSDNLEISLTSPNCSVQCENFDVEITNTTFPDCGENLGSIDLTIENGAAPITFTWQDGANTEDRTGLTGGSYVVTISDANGCFKLVEVPIATPNCGVGCDNFIIPFTIQDVTCTTNSGAIDLSAFGGTTPYTYRWADTEENIADRNELTAGTYELTVSDAGGCEKTASIMVGTADCAQEITPFDCSGAFYQIVEGQFNQLDLANDSLIPIGEESDNLNPLGYNVEDDFIYGLRFGTTDFVKIGKHGKREIIGRIQGINVGIIAGDFDLAGNFYLLDNESQRLQRVDISGTILVAATIQLSDEIPTLEDLSYNPIDKLLYGISSATNDVYSIDPITGDVKHFEVVGLPESGPVASTWVTNKGELVVSYNVTAAIYLIDLNNRTATLIGNTGDSAANADGANCVEGPSPIESLADRMFRFTAVSGTMTNEMAKIEYAVENEAEHANYILEHSIDGHSFKVLPSKNPAQGRATSTYEIEDKAPILGSGYYRVKYIMENGSYVYSDLVPLLFKPEGTPEVIVHPNPFIEELTINFLDPLLVDAKIIVTNNLGKIMEVCSAAKGSTRMNISCPNYPPGIYTIFVKHSRKLPIAFRTLKVE